jgi:hypothetical protein
MIRHEGQGPGRTPAEADTSPTLPLDGAGARDPGPEPTVPLEAADATVPLEAADASPSAEPARYVGPDRENTDVDEHGRVDLARLAWLVTVGACLIAVAILAVEGYYGYAAVTLAVAASAALNLT